MEFVRVEVITAATKLNGFKKAIAKLGVTGMTVSQVMGCGVEKGHLGRYKGVPTSMNLYPKVKVDIVVSTVDPGLVVAAAQKAIGTEHRGSGKIFVSDVEDVMRVRTGETGYDALND